MRARDQSSIFSSSGKFHPDYGLLLELHAVTLVARSYALLHNSIAQPVRFVKFDHPSIHLYPEELSHVVSPSCF